MLDTLFTNAQIVTHTGRFQGCLGVQDGKIACLAEKPDGLEAREVIDLEGKYLLPGCIDAHVHFQDPGITRREDFVCGTAAAAAGGVTTAISHPLNVPPAIDKESYEFTKNCYEGRGYVDYAVHGGAVASNLDRVDALWRETGATAIKMFMCFSVADFPYVEDDAMVSHFEILAKNGGLALIHCENDRLLKKEEARLKAEGRKDGLAYNESHPIDGEHEAVRRAIFFLEKTGAAAVILHVTNPEDLKTIREARARGVKVYAETCPHFFTFIKEDMLTHGPYLKFSPVMHDAADRDGMWEMLRKGYVDTFGSDHSPYEKSEKEPGETNIWDAPNGIPGIETLLPTLLNGVSEGKVSLERVVEVTSYNPSRIYGLWPRKGVLQPGSDADFVVVDMDLRHTYTVEDMKSKCKWSPYFGRTFQGWPVRTVVRGKTVCLNGQVVGTQGWGQYIPRLK